MKEPTDKVAIITGAGRGIGLGIAQYFAQRGYRVVIAEINTTTGQEAENTITAEGGKALFIHTDVRNEDSIEKMVEQIQAHWQRIDVLINNAAIGFTKHPCLLALAQWKEVLAVNLTGPFLCAKHAAKLMRQQGSGCIINIASTRALASEAFTESYSASKGGLLALTHALAVSLGADGIRVNAVSPGWIQTSGYEDLTLEDHHQHPAGRVGQPIDIAKACLFLADEAGFVTGQNLIIDGGMTTKMIYV